MGTLINGMGVPGGVANTLMVLSEIEPGGDALSLHGLHNINK